MRLFESLETSLLSSSSSSSSRQRQQQQQQPGDLIDRWRLTSDLFGRIFCDDVGIEPGSVVRRLAGFQLKEVRFRREMERLRNMATREVSLEVERDRGQLMVATFKALNNLYSIQCSRRVVQSSSVVVGGGSTLSTAASYPPPLCLSRVKVMFKDEQGEGSGVARSFYTAFADAVLADEPFPAALFHFVNNLVTDPSGLSSSSGGGGGGLVPGSNLSLSASCSPPPQYIPFSMHRYRHGAYRSSPGSSSGLANERRLNSTIIIRSSLRREMRDAPIVTTPNSTAAAQNLKSPPANSTTTLGLVQQQAQLQSNMKEDAQTQNISTSTTTTTTTTTTTSPTTGLGGSNQTTTSTTTLTANDDMPLFWQPDKNVPGFYSPRAGKNSTARLNAMRNVGRIIAICLLQNELCPISLSRHVIKYILDRPIRWHDLAFFDSQMYESFRRMISDVERRLIDQSRNNNNNNNSKQLDTVIAECNREIFGPLDLTFSVDLAEEEGVTYDLAPNGSKVAVDCSNMYEFVKRYARFRMLKHVRQCLESLKQGVFDVLPRDAFDGLNAEDFRLLLNGVQEVNIQTLASYTTIGDESKESARRGQFEKWFWSTLEKMSAQEKQELLFFWTGSPFLPASEEGFQPLPTITLRPPSDQHLPTANTCINRLYIPMYSSKSILKAKLLQAIKTKTFGFV